jgi:ABC-type transporter Mla subunit MlaD
VPKISQNDINKIGVVATLGIIAVLGFIFWLKGHNFVKNQEYTFYFENVNGLEEGSSLRWHGLKIGLVTNVKPVIQDKPCKVLPYKLLREVGERHLRETKAMLAESKLEDLLLIQEKVNQAQMEIALSKMAMMQTCIKKGQHVQVDVVVTEENIPIGLLNQVTIVPSGLIGEQYVDIYSINLDKDRDRLTYTKPRFISLEPIRFDSLIRANLESSEAVKNLSNRLNASFTDEDIAHVKALIKNSNALVKSSDDIVSDRKLRADLKDSVKNIEKITKDFDEKTREDIKQSAANIKEITTDFNLWKFVKFW